MPFPPLTVAVTGATGLIGSSLVTALRASGHVVRRLVRSTRDSEPTDILWDPERSQLDARALEGCDAVIHLAGAPIAQRWSSAYKTEILESRVKSTSLIARTIAGMGTKPSVVLSGSAIGYYGNRGAEILDESSGPGDDFLAHVVQKWEDSAARLVDVGVRLVTLRSGIVLSSHGGALGKMLLPFRMGAGGPIGGGQQWMSWIALHDHVRALEYLLRASDVSGPVNIVTASPVTNELFTETLGRVLNRPTIVRVPAFALELAYGEMADATILASQRALPRKLDASGFTPDFPTLEQALRHELSD